jgi:hypothetical protein
MRAERRVGQLLKETVRAGARGSNQYGYVEQRDTSSPRALEDYGLTRDQSSRWQSVATLSDEEFEAGLKDGATTSDMVEAAKMKQRGGPVEVPSVPVSTKALRLWGELDRMQRERWYDQDPERRHRSGLAGL